ncbi:MAG: hypothetical protein K6E28_00770 [Eubacterium sp.]|nr:hypothetical protein [Eubacterium sp.]
MKPVREILTFVIATIIFVFALLLAAIIPRDAIKEHMLESAEYLCEKEVFYNVSKTDFSSRIDRYADSILLGIAWQYDSQNPLPSVMNSAYYHNDKKNENENLLEAVQYDKSSNLQYLRYWHGSIAVVRPLLVFMPVKGIYIINGIVLFLLTCLLGVILFKKKYYMPLVGLIIGLVINSVWYVPFSLEYSWTFLLMILFGITVTILTEKRKREWYGAAFLCFGMVTCFFDFLTTETITLTVPALLLFCIETKENDDFKIKRFVRMPIAWGIGYVSTWLTKWLLASIVLHENVMPYVTGHVSERIGGNEFVNPGFADYILGALGRNLRCLLPFNYGAAGVIIGVAIIILYIYLAYVYRGKNIDKSKAALYLCAAAVPYIRFIVLHNHSYLHYFFTYRAQLGMVFAMTLLLLDGLKVWESLGNVRRHGKKANL